MMASYQSPFQVNSNPFGGDIQQYLAWNNIGKITVRYETTTIRDGEWATSSGLGSVGGCAIKIDFTDMEKHKPIKRNETFAVTHAALSEDAFLLADQESINYHRYSGAWSSDTSWIAKLPLEEAVEVIALCSDCAAVATTKKFVRIYSIGGLLTNVLNYR